MGWCRIHAAAQALVDQIVRLLGGAGTVISGCGALAVRLALFQPDIPQNTGTILRLAACLGIEVHIIGPAGFPTTDPHSVAPAWIISTR